MPPVNRIITVSLAAWFTLLATGAPLPLDRLVAQATRSVSPAERYPCENCPCGCSTAAHCWAECCCHTLPQRLMWAAREGVRPPGQALAQALREGLDVSRWLGPAGAGEREQASLPACCAKRRSCCSASQPACCNTKKPSDDRPMGVSIVQAMACEGLVTQWLAMSATILPEFVVADQTTMLVWTRPIPTLLLDGESTAPSPPPPRV